MKIIIQKVSHELYSAKVFNLPPNLSWVTPQWETPAPMRADELIRELESRGALQTDIGDAFYAADPDWLSK